MMKHSLKILFACVAFVFAVNCAQAKDNDLFGNEIIDCNAIAVDTELYIWNRVSDMLDIFQFGIGLGPGLGFEVALTDYLQLGMYANCEAGVLLPHVFPPFWLVDYYENNDFFVTHGGNYATLSFGPWRLENFKEVSAHAKARHFPRYDIDLNPSRKWDVRVEASAVLVHPYFSFRTLEFADFFTGIVGYDLIDDDCRQDPTAVRRPADQFGRGICNILFGICELPINVIRVNEIEGDLPAASKGVGLGVWRFMVREIVGVAELVTFPFGWEPIIEPEYVFQANSGSSWRVYRPSFHKRY